MVLEKDSAPAASAGRGAFLIAGYWRRGVFMSVGGSKAMHKILISDAPL